jgi:peptidylprolyl isomerase
MRFPLKSPLLSILLACAFAAPALAAPAPPTITAPAADFRPIPLARLMVIDTSKGRVVVELAPDLAPEHVERLVTLTKRGFYDGLKFFRVIDDFMDQTGDPGNDGKGGSDLPNLKGQFTLRRPEAGPFVAVGKMPDGTEYGFIGPAPAISQPGALAALMADGKVRAYGLFCPGTGGMARAGDPDSANSQFFLMRGTATMLDQKYTPWGRVVQGLDVVRSIATGEPPTAPDSMVKVRMASDLPPAEQPRLSRIDPASAAFRAQAATIAASRGNAFTPCDLELPVKAG